MFFHAANSCTHSARCRWTSATAWWIPKDGAQSAVIKNCLQYISTHLHEELRLEELAHECGAAQPQQYRDNPHGAYESQEGGGHDGQ